VCRSEPSSPKEASDATKLWWLAPDSDATEGIQLNAPPIESIHNVEGKEPSQYEGGQRNQVHMRTKDRSTTQELLMRQVRGSLRCRQFDRKTTDVGTRALRVVPGAKLGIGKLVGKFDAESTDRDSLSVMNGVLGSDEKVHVVCVVLQGN